MSKLSHVLLAFALVVMVATAVPSFGGAGVAALQTDPCVTPDPTVDVPTETATEVPTSTPDPTSTEVPSSTPDPTSTEVPTSTPDPTSTNGPPPLPDFAADHQGGLLAGDTRILARYIQVAGADPCETATVEPSEEATLGPATEPAGEATEEPVVQLPSTGSGSGDSEPFALLLVIAAVAGVAVWRIRKVAFFRS